jgi:beta-N-acetylhexosaminidase/beta-glucosidase
MAEEAAYGGINTVFAPVLDVDTNPLNPIIATRAFAGEPHTVSTCAVEMVRALESKGIRTCGKHFPGHGDTVADSHIALPVVGKSLTELASCELLPFSAAIRAGVSMMMIGHLRVPAIDPEGLPMTFSSSCVHYLRKSMNFHGVITTDAMNMGALEGYSPTHAARLALEAGVDMILHPEEPEAVARELADSGLIPSPERLLKFRAGLMPRPAAEQPPFDTALRDRLASLAIRTEGPPVTTRNPYIIILSDDEDETGSVFQTALGGRCHVPVHGDEIMPEAIPQGHDVVVAVFSPIRAWKGGTSPWLRACLRAVEHRADVFISFGNPHILDGVGAGATKIYAHWAAACAQESVARRLLSP